ncbi:MAG TPA: glycosyltransferase family 39 protein [Blastocatellia bacterium]|nr:glycosyltransferase family 39 protein [Blastocatellia bacterium]
MDKLKPHLDKLLLTVVFLVCATSTVLWTLKDQTPPSWDPSHHLCAAYDYYRPLGHFDLRGFAREFFQTKHYYAPLVHLVTAGFFLIFGASRLSGIAINLLSLAVLLGSVYWIGRRLYDNHGGPAGGAAIGLVAGVLTVSYHFNAWLLHDAFLDYPLLAHVTLTFALLIKADRFESRADAVRFAIAAGLGFWAKQTFGFFFILPGAYVGLRVLMTRDRRAIINLLLAGAIIAIIIAVWYGPHLQDAIAIYRINQRGALDENEPPVFSCTSLIFYWHTLISAQMQMPLAILFGLGLIYSLIRARRESLMLYLWLLSGIIMFTLVANKDVRYTVPVLPAAALLSVCWLREFYRRVVPRSDESPPSTFRWRKPLLALKLALVALIVGWAAVSFFNAQWPAAGQGTHVDTPYFRWWVFGRNYFVYDHRPQAHDWGIPEVVRTVAEFPYDETSPSVRAMTRPMVLRQKYLSLDPHETERAEKQPYGKEDLFVWPTLGVVVNRPFLNSSACAWSARTMVPERAGMPLVTIESIGDETEMADRLDHCDYLLVRSGLDHAEDVKPVERMIEAAVRNNPLRFHEVGRFPTPLDGIEAVLYKCW